MRLSGGPGPAMRRIPGFAVTLDPHVSENERYKQVCLFE
jgi:hypothetical protein